MAADGVAARAAAVTLLNAVLDEGLLLSQAIDDADGPLAPLTPAERARAGRLATAVLRQVEPLDRLLAPFLRKAPPLTIRNILRLAVLERSEGVAAHGVVNAAVGIARQGARTRHHAGLVNAVLRALPDPVVLQGPPQRLPRWLRQPLVHAWGREAVTGMEAVQSLPPPVDLTCRAWDEGPEGEVLPTGSLRLVNPGQISALPGYSDGGWWVQDAAAALAVPLLAPQPGEAVLDLCAAPGGKTLQLAAAGAVVTALDISSARMGRVSENLARCRFAATLITADALHWQAEAAFDAILLDAPCSATGTIRRHPDLPFVKDGSELPALVAMQAALIDRALAWLKPGGRLVFVTCSLLPDEGEAQLTAALSRHSGLTVETPVLPGIEPGWITPEGGLRLRPDYWADKGGMDGFFMVRLRRA